MRVRDESGFTIVEVLAAALILVIGLLATLGVFNDSRDENATGERAEIALMQAEQALEEMRGLPYSKLTMSAGAVDPTGGQRVVGAGGQFKVRPDLTEGLVYYTSEGVPVGDAWVDPTTSTQVGTEGGELNLTIHRFVTWRDEECRIVNLDLVGVNLPNAINSLVTATTNVVNAITSGLLGLLNPVIGNVTNQLKSRLNNLNAELAAIQSALAGISQLDLCDISVDLAGQLQKVGRLTALLPGVNPLLGTLQSALSACLPLLCNQTAVQNAVNGVNNQLNCITGATTSSGDSTYLDSVLAGINQLASGLDNTPKNSKRITVAVTVEPRNGVGPMQPVWASSVVRDPSAGLLTGGGTTC